MKAEDSTTSPFVFDTKTTADLRLKFKQDPQAGLKQAAQQFEGMLLQMVLKSMRDATPQDGLMESDQTRFFTSMLDQQLAQNLASKGALGLSTLIERQLGQQVASGGTDAMDSALAKLRQSLAERQAASSAAWVAGAAGNVRSQTAAVSPGAAVVPAEGADFVNRVWPHAVEAARSLNVPPHFLVAHSALESGWGKGEIRLPDGTSSFNVFGIKAGRSWSGPSVEVPTTEYVDGVAQTVRERFRVYRSYGEAFQDYANLLRGNARFSGVIGQQDGAQFARSLQQAGYATDPLYAEKLGRIIGGATLRQALTG